MSAAGTVHGIPLYIGQLCCNYHGLYMGHECLKACCCAAPRARCRATRHVKRYITSDNRNTGVPPAPALQPAAHGSRTAHGHAMCTARPGPAMLTRPRAESGPDPTAWRAGPAACPPPPAMLAYGYADYGALYIVSHTCWMDARHAPCGRVLHSPYTIHGRCLSAHARGRAHRSCLQLCTTIRGRCPPYRRAATARSHPV